MQFIPQKLEGVILVVPDVYKDDRGWFYETYNYEKFKAGGIDNVFIQDNQSYSAKKNVFRGIHFQQPPYAQSKLVRCTRGAIYDIVVDLRKGSPTYLQWEKVELSADNFHQLYIPKGFGHAFITITDDVEVCYKVDAPYNKISDRSIQAVDPSIGLDVDADKLIRSEKDILAPLAKDSDCQFIYKETNND